MIWRRKAAIIAAMGISLLVGVAYLLLATPIYTSQSQIYYQQLTPRLGHEDGTPARTANFLNTEVEVIRSSAVLAVALTDPQMEDVAIVRDELYPIRALKQGLDVSIGKNNDIITVSYDSPNPRDAQSIVAAVVRAYQTFQSDQRRQALDAMERERQKIMQELAARNRDLIALKKQFGTLTFEQDKDNPVLQHLHNLSEALTDARFDAIEAETAYQEAAGAIAGNSELQRRLGGLTGSGTLVSAGDLQTLRNELFNLQQRLQEARHTYGERHPMVGSLEARVEHLTVAYVAAARERWLAAQRRRDELQRSYDQQHELVLQMQSRQLEVEQLQREIHRLETLADEIGARTKAMTAMEGAGALNITILEEATLPDEPSQPQMRQVMAISLVGGFLLGLGLVVISEWRDKSLRSAEEVKAALKVPVLGVVPSMQQGLSPIERGMKVHLDPSSDIAEAYRTVRTALYFGLPDENSKTLLVTSPQAGDGKSTLVSNLAIAMAQAGRRVLVIDADFRLPTQHKIFNVVAGGGLSGVLSGKISLEAAIVPTSVENLDLLPCGPIPRNPSEILNSQHFSDLLGDLAAKYDHVVLDSPALMAVADARIASAWCDATLLVLHAERTDRRMAVLARDGLVAVGANLVGVIVNGVDRNTRRHSFYADFGYNKPREPQQEVPTIMTPWEEPSDAAAPQVAAEPALQTLEDPDPQPAVEPVARQAENNGTPASQEPQRPVVSLDPKVLAETSARLRKGFEALR